MLFRMIRRTYVVQVVDASTGAEDSIRVQAASAEAAVEVLSAMDTGKVVGLARLVEVSVEEPSPGDREAATASVPRKLGGTVRRMVPMDWVRAIGFGLFLLFAVVSCPRGYTPHEQVFGKPGHRFKSEYAEGATANALEAMRRDLDFWGAWLMLGFALVVATSGRSR